MISKKVSMKTPEKSRFGKLVDYLVNDQGKHTRVGEVTITNCVSTDLALAVREIAATQQLNTRGQSDRTYSGATDRAKPSKYIPSSRMRGARTVRLVSSATTSSSALNDPRRMTCAVGYRRSRCPQSS